MKRMKRMMMMTGWRLHCKDCICALALQQLRRGGFEGVVDDGERGEMHHVDDGERGEHMVHIARWLIRQSLFFENLPQPIKLVYHSQTLFELGWTWKYLDDHHMAQNILQRPQTASISVQRYFLRLNVSVTIGDITENLWGNVFLIWGGHGFWGGMRVMGVGVMQGAQDFCCNSSNIPCWCSHNPLSSSTPLYHHILRPLLQYNIDMSSQTKMVSLNESEQEHEKQIVPEKCKSFID